MSTPTQDRHRDTNGGGFNPGPWAPGGFVMVGGRRYRVWHVALPTRPGIRRELPDRAWGVLICDRVAPRGTMHILDHVPTLSVATY